MKDRNGKAARNAPEGGTDAACRARAGGTDNDGGVVYVAVYGTLMRGERNERWRDGIPTVARGTVRGMLFDTGWGFPEFQPDIGGDRVCVEVLKTDAAGVARMDRLEGCPDFYARERVAVTVSSNRTMDCEVYVMREERRPLGEARIRPDGAGVADWRAYRKAAERAG